MMNKCAGLTILAVAAVLAVAPPSYATPAREALVIGNGTYGTLPPVAACLQSAHAVAAALRGLGFGVVEREDVSTGGIDAAIADFARELATSPGATAVIYTCGYVTPFNDRPFMLPVTARIGRPADVLTQGVLAKTLIDVMARGGAGSALVAIDGVQLPGGPARTGLETLAQVPMIPGLGLVAAGQVKPADAPTPLANALVADLRGAEVTVAALLDKIQQQMTGKPADVAALRAPTQPSYLAGAPEPPPPPAPAPARPPPPAQPAVVAPAPAPPMIMMPADDAMTDADRRTVQEALARLGYYPGPIDAIFGPDTRAAIRRYQHELGADMTGRLTSQEASRLVSNR